MTPGELDAASTSRLQRSGSRDPGGNWVSSSHAGDAAIDDAIADRRQRKLQPWRRVDRQDGGHLTDSVGGGGEGDATQRVHGQPDEAESPAVAVGLVARGADALGR